MDGQRVTDEATMEIAKMVLVGKVNKEIVGLIARHGGTAVGISGEDGRLLTCEPKKHQDKAGNDVDLGFVGEIVDVDVSVLDLLAEANIPVVATVGADDQGHGYNINADTVAGELAAALHAEKILFLTDVDGIYEDQGGEMTLDLGVRPRLPRRAAGRRPHHRRHDPQGRRRTPRARVRRAQRPRHRRPRGARRAARDPHRRRLRHQGDGVSASAVASGSVSGGACIFCDPLVYSMHACMDGRRPSPAWAGVVETGVLRDVIARPPMSKTERQRLIQTVVQQREVATQRELVSALSALGCEVTQATVSRDIRELDLQKVRTHLGRAKYVLSSRERPKDPEQAARHVMRDFARSTSVSQQLVVVRCEIGTATTVARQIDNLNHTDVVGTLAGDDTFLVIVGDSDTAQSMKRYLDRLREA